MTELRCQTLEGHSIDIRPADQRRDWMDATPHRFAYRCLPLTLANSCGWEILVSEAFTAVWTGSDDTDAVLVSDTDSRPAISHFGSGILTFHVHALFRTEGNTSLMVRGPVNRPKDGIAALDGIVETWWSPFTFTMNWQFTRPHHPVSFDKGEPFCTILPVDVAALQAVQPTISPISADPEAATRLADWTRSRDDFNKRLKESAPGALEEDWQKHYSRGTDLAGNAATGTHLTKLRLKPFRPVT